LNQAPAGDWMGPGDQWICVNGTSHTATVDITAQYDNWSVQSNNANCAAGLGTGQGIANAGAFSCIPPTCTGAYPQSAWTNSNSGTFYAYTTGCNNVTKVLFPTWSNPGGQDDLRWYGRPPYEANVVNQGGGTWRVSIDLAAHLGEGGIPVHIYMDNGNYQNIWFTTANFGRDTVVPSIPGAISINSCAGSQTLGWVAATDAASGVKDYYLRVNDITDTSGWKGTCDPTVTQFPGDYCVDYIAATSYPITVVAGHTYNVWIHAGDNAGNINWSSSSTSFTGTSVPANPTGLNISEGATITTSPYTVSWTAVTATPAVDRYVLCIKKSGEAACHIDPASAACLAFDNHNITSISQSVTFANGDHRLRLLAHNSCGFSDGGVTANGLFRNFTVSVCPAVPAAPSFSSPAHDVSVNTKQPTLSITGGSTENQFAVVAAAADGSCNFAGAWAWNSGWQAGASYTGADLAEGQKYCWRARSRADACQGETSNWTSEGLRSYRYFTVNTRPTMANITISSATVIPNGTTQYTIAVQGSDPNGAADIMQLHSLLNYQGENVGQYRGYLLWSVNSSSVSGWKNVQTCTDAGGYAAIYPYGYGFEYLNLLSCSVSGSGNNRTVNLVVSFNPVYTTPVIDNDISGWVYDYNWQNDPSNDWKNFNTDFNLQLCGNGSCDASENCGTCPAECTWGATQCCVSNAIVAQGDCTPTTWGACSVACGAGTQTGTCVEAVCNRTLTKSQGCTGPDTNKCGLCTNPSTPAAATSLATDNSCSNPNFSWTGSTQAQGYCVNIARTVADLTGQTGTWASNCYTLAQASCSGADTSCTINWGTGLEGTWYWRVFTDGWDDGGVGGIACSDAMSAGNATFTPPIADTGSWHDCTAGAPTCDQATSGTEYMDQKDACNNLYNNNRSQACSKAATGCAANSCCNSHACAAQGDCTPTTWGACSVACGGTQTGTCVEATCSRTLTKSQACAPDAPKCGLCSNPSAPTVTGLSTNVCKTPIFSWTGSTNSYGYCVNVAETAADLTGQTGTWQSKCYTPAEVSCSGADVSCTIDWGAVLPNTIYWRVWADGWNGGNQCADVYSNNATHTVTWSQTGSWHDCTAGAPTCDQSTSGTEYKDGIDACSATSADYYSQACSKAATGCAANSCCNSHACAAQGDCTPTTWGICSNACGGTQSGTCVEAVCGNTLTKSQACAPDANTCGLCSNPSAPTVTGLSTNVCKTPIFSWTGSTNSYGYCVNVAETAADLTGQTGTWQSKCYTLAQASCSGADVSCAIDWGAVLPNTIYWRVWSDGWNGGNQCADVYSTNATHTVTWSPTGAWHSCTAGAPTCDQATSGTEYKDGIDACSATSADYYSQACSKAATGCAANSCCNSHACAVQGDCTATNWGACSNACGGTQTGTCIEAVCGRTLPKSQACAPDANTCNKCGNTPGTPANPTGLASTQVSTNCSNAATLSWTAGAINCNVNCTCTTSYEYKAWREGTSEPANGTAASSASVSLASLADGTWHWKVRQSNAFNWSAAWVSGADFIVDTTKPAATTLVSPANGAATADNTPTLTIAPPADAASSQIAVDDTNPIAGDWVDNSGWIAGTTFTTKTLADGTYYWRAHSQDVCANGADLVDTNWATVRSFVVDTTPPTCTASPAAICYTSAQSVTLSNSESGDIYYTTDGTDPKTSTPPSKKKYNNALGPYSSATTVKFYCIDGVGNESSVVTSAYTFDTACPTTVGLRCGGTRCSGAITCSSADSLTCLYCGNTPGTPANPTGLASAQVSPNCSNAATLSWTAGAVNCNVNCTCTTSYEYKAWRVGTTEPANGTAPTPASSASVSLASLADGTWHWKTRQSNAFNWSAAWVSGTDFIVDTTKPAAPALSTPADGAATKGTPLGSAANPVLFAKWGVPGTGNGQFTNPTGITADASGNIYAVDSDNNRVQKFTAEGVFITKWGALGSGNGQFTNPTGITADSSGNIYVIDSGNSRVQKFSSTGTFLTKWGVPGTGDGQFTNPRGITADALGNVYVADTGNSRIQKFNSTGTFLTKWGVPGTGDGQFTNPRGITADASGDVYVVDTGNFRVQKFNLAGTFITKWGSSGAGNGQFTNPWGIVADASGNIYVVDSDNNRVQKFTAEGVFITKWGALGSGDGQFTGPRGVAADPSGNIYVMDAGNSRVQRFFVPTSSVEFTSAIPVGGFKNQTAVDNETGFNNPWIGNSGWINLESFSTLLADGTYYWKAHGQDVCGNGADLIDTNWSAARSVCVDTVISDPPGQPAAACNSADLTNSVVAFSWPASDDTGCAGCSGKACKYWLQLDDGVSSPWPLNDGNWNPVTSALYNGT
ncbi:MAG: 6-bladed beta-propeller, partial [bacterium]|nr:6-bladed beta-propeller [bacterium]